MYDNFHIGYFYQVFQPTHLHKSKLVDTTVESTFDYFLMKFSV